MINQPEALRLAEFLEMHWCNVDMPEAKAAAELRRLHAENERLTIERDEARRTARQAHEMGTRVFAQRDALLEALKLIVEFVDAPTEGKRPDVFVMRISKARAAIAKAEGEKA